MVVGLSAVAAVVGVGVARDRADDVETIHLNDDAVGAAPDGAAPTAGVTGRVLPDVVVEDANGAAIDTGALVGEPLVVNFWYSSCPGCERELPDFARVHEQLGGRVRFVGINPVDQPERAAEFARRHDVTYDTLFDHNGNLVEGLEVVGFPSTYLVDPAGVVVFEHTGVLDADELTAAIADHLLVDDPNR